MGFAALEWLLDLLVATVGICLVIALVRFSFTLVKVAAIVVWTMIILMLMDSDDNFSPIRITLFIAFVVWIGYAGYHHFFAS